MKVRPLHDRVLIKRIEEQETVRGGIIIPDTAKEKSQEGEVIAVGTGKMLENGSVAALEVKAGDRILFGKYSGTEIKLEDQDYLILREDEIIGIFTKAGKAAGKN
jgi:chaperonin GroES